MAGKKRIIIIGGIAAGTAAAARCRRMDEGLEIVIYEKDRHISYGTCGLPYSVSGKIRNINKLLINTPRHFSRRFNVDVRTSHEVEKIILVGGKAGLGAARTSILLGRMFAKMGYYVFNYRDYPSLIRGGHNFNVLKISDKPVFSHDEEYDAILAFDQLTVDKHEKNLKPDGFVIGDLRKMDN